MKIELKERSLKALSMEELLTQTRFLVKEEMRIDLELMAHLREVERRFLYAELGFSSLWDFCIRYLNLSEGSSQRRIAAMRLCRDLPEVKESMEDGRLNLSNAAQLQSFFQAEKKEGLQRSVEEKKEIVKSVLGLSQKQCAEQLAVISPAAALPNEREKILTEEKTELRLILDRQTMENLNRLKNLLGHQIGGATYSDLVTYLTDEVLKKLEKKKNGKGDQVQDQGRGREVQPESQKQESTIAAAVNESEQAGIEIESKDESNDESKDKSKKGLENPDMKPVPRKHIPVSIQRLIWKRSGGQCEFVSPDGLRCVCKFGLQLDHVRPLALGGTNHPLNLRYLCANHNAYEAMVILGRQVMEKYVPHLSG